MSYHIDYDRHCPKCRAKCIPFEEGVPCPKCGSVENDTFDFISEGAESARVNWLSNGTYLPDSWSFSGFGDQVAFAVFQLLEAHRTNTENKAFSEIAQPLLEAPNWEGREYLSGHFLEIANRIRTRLDQIEQDSSN